MTHHTALHLQDTSIMMEQESQYRPKGLPLAVQVMAFLEQLPSFWLKKNGKPIPKTKMLSNMIENEILRAMLAVSAIVMVKHLSEARKNVLSEKQKRSFDFICRLCYLKTLRGSVSKQEFANELHNSCIESLKKEDLLNLVIELPHKDSNAIGEHYNVVHPLIEKFLAAVYLVQRPLMEIFEFVTENLETSDGGWTVLKILAGLSYNSGWNCNIRSTLPQVLNGLFTIMLPVNEPVILLHEFFHILDCIAESQNVVLYRMLLHEFLTARTVVFRAKDLSVWGDLIASFIVNSLPSSEHWTIYSYSASTMAEVLELRRKVVLSDSYVVVGDLSEMSIVVERDLVILTTRKRDYLRDTLTPMLHLRLSHKAVVHSSGTLLSSVHMSPSFVGPCRGPVPYGYLTEEEYQSKLKLKCSAHFNMIKDAIVPHITPYSTQPVQAQYRKNDHLWFSFSRNLRHDWYQTVRTTPHLPVHWVKVTQPDGFEHVETRFKNQARVQLESGSRETAELVLLNSQPLDLIEIATPSSEEPITIALQGNIEPRDQGIIGCDFLLDKYDTGETKFFNSHPFDVKQDLRIGCLLPLPSKKDLSASTTLVSAAEGMEGPQGQPAGQQADARPRPAAKPPPQSPVSTLGSYFPKFSKPYQDAEAQAEEAMVSEHQIKKEAMNGFDIPGYCFYGDSLFFEMTKVYSLPDSLSTCRMLREGGNGVVLEVKFSGELFAVKKTAFRWREVLIMPKLRHRNILKLVALVIGKPIEGHPKRRYVYQVYPKLTNDLGRSVGSFEKHCLRTLMERYRGEPLLLNKIKSNFCYVAHEILVALDYLHTRPCPIIHRDVKTSNILIKMLCDCPNPLICVCRRRPDIVLSDFDASLELSSDGTLEPDPPRASSFGYAALPTKVYHVSAVGTVGYKSPEGSMYCTGNSLDVMPPLSTKADIFGFGLVLSLLLLNQEGPKSMVEMGQLLLSVNQKVGPNQPLSGQQKENLKKNNIRRLRPMEIAVSPQDIDRVLPLGRAKRELHDPQLLDFLNQCLEPNPKYRASAETLLKHPYLNQLQASASKLGVAVHHQPASFIRGPANFPHQHASSIYSSLISSTCYERKDSSEISSDLIDGVEKCIHTSLTPNMQSETMKYPSLSTFFSIDESSEESTMTHPIHSLGGNDPLLFGSLPQGPESKVVPKPLSKMSRRLFKIASYRASASLHPFRSASEMNVKGST